jgi:hypothetical protein
VGSFRRALAGILALTVATVAAAQQDLQIQFAEPVSIQASAGTSQFDAYGRRFMLRLESNDRVLNKLTAAQKVGMGGQRLFRGRLDGLPGSWVRLSRVGDRVRGLIWDGRELYVVTRFGDVAEAVIAPTNAAADQTVVFRLSDSNNVLPRMYCAAQAGTSSGPVNGLEQFKALLAEVRADRVAVTRQMDVALVADSAFQAQQGANTTAAMLAMLNEADGIFADQAGLLLNAGEVRLVPSVGDPFTSTNAETLLDQLSTYRVGDVPIGAAAIAHLVTGKDLDGDTAGIAVRSGVCNIENGVSLTMGFSFYGGLIMAHEIAHNLGAVHDGDGACAAAPPNLLMAPVLSGSSIFSQCSLDTMRPLIDSASCIVPGVAADLTVDLALSTPTPEYNEPFTVTATVISQGSAVAQNASLELAPIGHVEIVSISPSSGSCNASTTPVCTLGDIPHGESRTVTLTLRPYQPTPSGSVQAEVDSDNDRAPANDDDAINFTVVNNADARLTLSPGSATVRTGDAVEFTARVQSIRTRTVRNVRLSGTPLGLSQVTYSPSVGTCTGFGDCTLGDLAAGGEATVVIRGTATNTGAYAHTYRIDSLDDTDGSNNFSTFNLTMNPRRNLAIAGSRDSVVLSVGDALTTEFVVSNTLGIEPVSGATVQIFGDFMVPIENVSSAGATCTVTSSSRANCALGTVAVGESRTIAVQVRGANTGNTGVAARIEAAADEVSNDNYWSNGVSVRNPIDLRVAVPYWPERIESRTATEDVPIYSASSLAATDFVATIEVPGTARLITLAMADTVCVIQDAQHGQCTATTLPHQFSRALRVGAVGDSPGAHRVRVTIAATSDADLSDNSAEFDMRVGAYRDASVSAFTLPRYLHVGQTYDFETRLRSAYRDVANVDFSVTHPAQAILTLPQELTGCTTTRSFDGLYDTLRCPIATLPANTDRLLRFQLRPTVVDVGGRVGIQALTTPDVDHANNYVEQHSLVVEDSDVALSLSSATVTVTTGTRLALPRITLRSPRVAHGMTLRVPIPAFASVDSVSSGWICTGGTTLECDIPALSANGETSIEVFLNTTSAGTFTSRIEVSVANDANVANNAADVAITVNAAASTPNPPSGGGGGSSSGGGGGGSFEWLSLAALSILLWRRFMIRPN